MDEFEINLSASYTLDYESLSKSKNLMAITKLLALQIMKTPYINVGEYIQNISDSDLKELLRKMDKPENGDYELEDLILIADMLAAGEGLGTAQDFDTFHQRMDQLVGFLVIESLKRKGLVKVYYENLSFGDDMGDKLVVEKI